MHAAAAVPEVLEKSGRHLHNTGGGPFRSQAQFILSCQEMDIFGRVFKFNVLSIYELMV
jgi:hypothetical protein